jgi:hypothetical protein
LEVDACFKFSVHEPAHQRAAKFTNRHADESVAQRLASHLLKLCARLKMKWKAVEPAENIHNRPRRFRHRRAIR